MAGSLRFITGRKSIFEDYDFFVPQQYSREAEPELEFREMSNKSHYMRVYVLGMCTLG